jgi:hypothetical protein
VSVLVALVAASAVVVAAVVSDDGSSEGPEATGVHGPLCDALPSGDQPGNPSALAGLDATDALTWIPVLTIFEAGTRAAGLADELDRITILAPTDDAFLVAMTQETLDELIISRQDELALLLQSHVVDGRFSVAELVAAGRVTTRSGETLTVEASADGAVLGDGAETACSDYHVADATIHVIDAVLGEIPAPAPPAEPAHE